MELEGVVHNGVIVPDDATALPEGARVRISPALAAKAETSSSPPAPESSLEVPCGILRSQQAFWRDLPELLKTKRNHGRWVCYHGDERVGIGTHEQLIRACIQRGIPDDAFHPRPDRSTSGCPLGGRRGRAFPASRVRRSQKP